MPDGHVAFYARVSTEGQARDNTIASQITALRERIAVDGGQLEPDDAYVDEGYSGSVLVRPALERLRDAAAAGRIGQLYVLAPDRHPPPGQAGAGRQPGCGAARSTNQGRSRTWHKACRQGSGAA